MKELRILLFQTALYNYHKVMYLKKEIVISFFIITMSASVPRMYALFFIDCQSLRELRITSVLMIAAIQKRNVGRIRCNGPVNFFSERRYFKQHMRFPALPPPPIKLRSSPWQPPPPPQKLRCSRGGVISGSRAPTGAFSL